MYLLFYLPLYSAEFVSKTHFVQEFNFINKVLTTLWFEIQLSDKT